jgi:hypothetical protein
MRRVEILALVTGPRKFHVEFVQVERGSVLSGDHDFPNERLVGRIRDFEYERVRYFRRERTSSQHVFPDNAQSDWRSLIYGSVYGVHVYFRPEFSRIHGIGRHVRVHVYRLVEIVEPNTDRLEYFDGENVS